MFGAVLAALLKWHGSGSVRKGGRLMPRGVPPVLSLCEDDIQLTNCRGSHREGPNPFHFICHEGINCMYLREFYRYNMQLPPKEEVRAAICGDLP